MNEICEKCGKQITIDYRKNQSTPLRFCSRSCANSRVHNSSTKEKISLNVKRNWNAMQYECEYCHRRFKHKEQYESHKKECTPENRISIKRRLNNEAKRKKRYTENKIKIRYTEINITQEKLDEYKKTHPVCEICGRTVEEANNATSRNKRYNLCIDHNHETLDFRGLLCVNCNANLGWYEKNKVQIEKYLNKPI